ncbi:hypothetical protein Anas_04957 [Armadillidium nasatum]|uniref:CHK kinase-like domain-containing protein n=1 Tax=Armadillidium nasatum TaxID=96803 RepID=A0A5N5SZZ9_9CRUS|nr:hypothetical protein Anas_04957 [Armadillidium nasatum]
MFKYIFHVIVSEDGSVPKIKSYELVTEELVLQALWNDKGQNAKVLSWEIKEFTSKGDGYMSVVASIVIKYKENGKELDESYVVKLNPLRPASSMTDLAGYMIARESVIFSSVIGNMSKHLRKLGLPPIKTPKIYARSLSKEREAFVTENLRKQGFVMHDRKKGQDLNHAILVLEELGRFHASSLLLEDTIAPKTFVETFDHFQTQVECTIKYLSEIPKYKKCVQWLKANIDSVGHYYLDGNTPKEPFDVLVHGDCWTNNMLFKYNSKNKPEDVRFVDLQCSRKASPASDIAYFIFTSLNGEIRSSYMKELLLSYYQSFTRILILARKKIPFKFKELEGELEKKKIYGLICGIMIVVGALFVEGEDEMYNLEGFSDDKLDEFADEQVKHFQKIAEREGSFKDRFLSLFDDMLTSPVFEIQ